MPVVQWPHRNDRPTIQVVLTSTAGQDVSRSLVADTGAGTRQDLFELILDEDDCLHCGGIPVHQVRLSGSYHGVFPIYLMDVRLPALSFEDSIPVVGVTRLPRGFDGIACFRFLNRFSYGNFGDPLRFGLDALKPPNAT